MSEQLNIALTHWKQDSFAQAVFQEVKDSLHKEEMQLVSKETKILVEKNKALGGSEHGFYYKSELFVVAGAYGKSGIEMLHQSLEEEAEYLRLNRKEVQQYTTYIAHLLAALLTSCKSNPSVFCANCPRGLMQYSSLLNTLDRYCQTEDAEFYKTAVFDENDKSLAAFFAHCGRVNNPINRFLFRRVVS